MVYLIAVKYSPYITLIGLVMAIACQPEASPVKSTTFTYEDLYRIHLPDHLYQAYDMHVYASLQYYDTLMGLYVLGIVDPKENLGDIKRKRLKLAGYYNFVEKTVFTHADSLEQVSEQEFEYMPGAQALVGDYYTHRVDGSTPVFYRLSIFDHPDYFFQLVTYLPYEIHCDQMPWIDTITNSFRFLPEEVPVAGIR